MNIAIVVVALESTWSRQLQSDRSNRDLFQMATRSFSQAPALSTPMQIAMLGDISKPVERVSQPT